MKALPRGRQFMSFTLLVVAALAGMLLVGSPNLLATGAESTAGAGSGAGVEAAAADQGGTAVAVRLPQGLPSFADLAEGALPAVVSIESQTIAKNRPTRGFGGQQGEGRDPFEFFFGPRGRRNAPEDRGREFRSDSGGSGFVISPDGYVITNNHVIEGATKVRVRLNERLYDAEIKGADPATDLALLKIDAGRT
ncbi:MAG: trypsin-like peptidase domain-containing protein [Thermoanaerobaculia bacterium]